MRASQQAFMQHHAQQRYVWLDLRMVLELMEQCMKAAAWGCPVGKDTSMALLGWGVSLPDLWGPCTLSMERACALQGLDFLVSQSTEQCQLCVTCRLNSIRRAHGMIISQFDVACSSRLCTSTSTWSVLTVSCKTRSCRGHAAHSSSQTSSTSAQRCIDRGRQRAPMS